MVVMLENFSGKFYIRKVWKLSMSGWKSVVKLIIYKWGRKGVTVSQVLQ